MLALITLLSVLVLSLVVVRVATVALTLTGLSHQLARFQARSAFTGAGFTTSESENVVQHPVRRRIIMLLMLLGNAGVITAASSLILSFVNVQENQGIIGSPWFRMTLLLGGLAVLWMVANSHWVDQRMSKVIAWALKRWTKLELQDYAGLLHLTGGYMVVELLVEPGDWLADRTLQELRLADEGILVLGVEQAHGAYIGAPRGGARLAAGDTLLLYGRLEDVENLDERRAGAAGNWDHHKAVDRQHRRMQSETEQSQPEGAATEQVPGEQSETQTEPSSPSP